MSTLHKKTGLVIYIDEEDNLYLLRYIVHKDVKGLTILSYAVLFSTEEYQGWYVHKARTVGYIGYGGNGEVKFTKDLEVNSYTFEQIGIIEHIKAIYDEGLSSEQKDRCLKYIYILNVFNMFLLQPLKFTANVKLSPDKDIILTDDNNNIIKVTEIMSISRNINNTIDDIGLQTDELLYRIP